MSGPEGVWMVQRCPLVNSKPEWFWHSCAADEDEAMEQMALPQCFPGALDYDFRIRRYIPDPKEFQSTRPARGATPP